MMSLLVFQHLHPLLGDAAWRLMPPESPLRTLD
jgi:hypothetical protein